MGWAPGGFCASYGIHICVVQLAWFDFMCWDGLRWLLCELWWTLCVCGGLCRTSSSWTWVWKTPRRNWTPGSTSSASGASLSCSSATAVNALRSPLPCSHHCKELQRVVHTCLRSFCRLIAHLSCSSIGFYRLRSHDRCAVLWFGRS